ncbi:AraC family transcriptional regulator [Polymorphum gilvum]|uniref:Probable transcriptional regulator protein, AraC family protein n=1 Tax=Polymorphum gilvum (strain LMG 25793 / CGMCC 1.9160 / SL003B-26A1) TaxID=991905 RepID=F2J3C6_POLGS|nr:helix-turn-helix transcriptional regulator [Polymorphum gilvum]ADZ69933.1 Probable transcriptional regulator protein, AraC family protein [Polymorphum gilvum SL003B-26A1]
MPIHPDLRRFPTGPLPAQVVGLATEEAAGAVTAWHAHDVAQLFHLVRGSIAIDTEVGTFFVPPERAVWLPPRFAHETRYLTDTEVRYLYVSAEVAADMPGEPRVLQMTALLRELILAFMTYPRAETVEGPAARLAAVILDQMALLPASPLRLPMPRELRLRALCEKIVRCPADLPALADAAAASALSVRSFERRMVRETGLTYRTWCRQVKLFRSLELLAGGASVSDVSHSLGYEGPSAFVATFRKAFGVTPGRYFQEPRRT